MKLNIKKLHPAATIPEYASEGAACFDLRCIKGGTVQARSSELFHTGLAFEVPEGWVMHVYSRSGHGFKNGLRLVNCVGIIDSDYRGEVMVKLTCDLNASSDNEPPYYIHPGDRIAQAMIVPVLKCSFEEVAELSDTVRGTGGLGSTGV